LNKKLYNRHRHLLTGILRDALEIMAPEKRMQQLVSLDKNKLHIADQTIDLNETGNVWIFGAGKAAPRMACMLENLLGKRIKDGIVITHNLNQAGTSIIQQFESDHPIPSSRSVSASYELVNLAGKVKKGDLVLFCITGGASSLFTLPAGSLELEDLQATHQKLLNSGANIQEINIVRKHLSAVKGGQMMRYFKGTSLVNLIISDVPGDDPTHIGSGPAVADQSSFEQAFQILKKYKLWVDVPQNVRTHIAKGMNGLIPDTISKKDDDYVDASVHMVGTARQMGLAVKKLLEQQEYNVWIDNKAYDMPVRKISKKISAKALEVLKENKPVHKPGALVFYGESTVHVTGDGLGGRNQELALNVALSLEGQHHISLMSVGTDGRDGPTDSAGAFVNASTILEARQRYLEPETYLENNDSYNFFDQTKNHIKIGATGNNLMDLQVVLIDS